MKARFVVLGLAFAFCLRANADPFPVIDVRYGYLIGAVDSGNWLEPTDATASVKSGAKLRVYGVLGDVGGAQVLKVDMQNEPCPDRPVVKLRPPKVAKARLRLPRVGIRSRENRNQSTRNSGSNMPELFANFCAHAAFATRSCTSARL